MKRMIKIAPMYEAVFALLIESAPKDGPTLRSSNCSRVAGKAPARRAVEIIFASSIIFLESRPPPKVITADPPAIRSRIEGADFTTLSRTIAICLPTLPPVKSANLAEPAALKFNDT
ncbi:hypothetical protein D3C87_1616200 [compost metagenome]